MDMIKQAKTETLFSQLKDILIELDIRYKNIDSTIEFFNKQQEEVEHQIESTPFNARDGFKMAKKIQEVRRLRRIVKNDSYIFNQLFRPYDSDRWNEFVTRIDKFLSHRLFSDEQLAKNDEWLNVDKLGVVTHEMVDEYQTNKLPSVDEQLSRIKNRSELHG